MAKGLRKRHSIQFRVPVLFSSGLNIALSLTKPDAPFILAASLNLLQKR